MGDAFGINTEYINHFREDQFNALCKEEEAAGGYAHWFEQLKEFRAYIYRRYMKFGIPKKMYRPRVVVTERGDLIDHHTISYMAPLNFKRIGWGGKRLAPHEQIKQLSDFFKKRGKRFIYAPLPNKGNIYPSLICDAVSSGGYWGINVVNLSQNNPFLHIRK